MVYSADFSDILLRIFHILCKWLPLRITDWGKCIPPFCIPYSVLCILYSEPAYMHCIFRLFIISFSWKLLTCTFALITSMICLSTSAYMQCLQCTLMFIHFVHFTRRYLFTFDVPVCRTFVLSKTRSWDLKPSSSDYYKHQV